MKNFLLFLLLVALHFKGFSQCISTFGCPQSADLFCQNGSNDPEFWKADYWTDPVLGTQDLYEAPVDVNIMVLNTCGNADQLSVRYQLYLDLNQDGVEETIIDSDQLPKGDTVYFGNNITTSTALPYRFDFRAVAPELRYRFALQKQISGDTLRAALRWHTAAKPTEYVLPKLPGQGRCRLVWIIQKDAETQRCERVFQVRDCEKPQVECKKLELTLNTSKLVTLWGIDLLQTWSDNICPTNLLELSVRKKGTNTNFPLDAEGKPFKFITLDCCSDIGTTDVELWARDKTGNATRCLTQVTVKDPYKNCSCVGSTKICSYSHCNNQSPLIVFYEIHGSLPNGVPLFKSAKPDPDYCTNLSQNILFPSSFYLVPFKNENPLNGVSTYDLVLLSKHILGIEPLGSPYLMIAADANASNSITTLDIVEIRKLILGIYTTYPKTTSWRFVPASHIFVDTGNPFLNPFPEALLLDSLVKKPQFNYVGVKIGDLNCNSFANFDDPAPTEDRAVPISLQVPDPQLQTGEILEIPLHINAETAFNGFQFDLQFDPQLIDIHSVTPQNIQNFSAENYSRSADGSLRVSWADARAQARATLVLRLRALAPVRLSEALAFADQSIRAEAYSSDNAIHPLHLQFAKEAAIESLHIGEPWPNPSATGFTFDLQSNDNEHLNIQISDLSGRVVYQTGRDVPQGASTMTVPASALPQAGVYGWRVQLGSHFKGGKLVVK